MTAVTTLAITRTAAKATTLTCVETFDHLCRPGEPPGGRLDALRSERPVPEPMDGTN
ncbi:MAG: hypothetical protein ACLGHX_12010 [Acidimicrobiia bacterium]